MPWMTLPLLVLFVSPFGLQHFGRRHNCAYRRHDSDSRAASKGDIELKTGASNPCKVHQITRAWTWFEKDRKQRELLAADVLAREIL